MLLTCVPLCSSVFSNLFSLFGPSLGVGRVTFVSFYHFVPFLFSTCIDISSKLQIGEVVDGPDDSFKQPVLEGIQYDYGDFFNYLFCMVLLIYFFSLFLYKI